MEDNVYFDEDQINRILNHCRLTQLIQRSTGYLQQIFRHRWEAYRALNNSISEWNDDKASKKELKNSCTSAKQKQNVKCLIKTLDSSFWDITAANCAITVVSEAIEALGGSIDANEDFHIETLRKTRNCLMHRKPELIDDEFNKHWNEIKTILIDFGDNADSIDSLKTELLEIGKSSNSAMPDTTSEFAKQKQLANKSYIDGKYEEAIEAYTKILELNSLLPEQIAVIYSNRSIANLKLNSNIHFRKAEMDALWATQLSPCYGKAYFRLAKAQIKLEKWYEVETSLYKAFVLEFTSQKRNEIRDEISMIRRKIGVMSRRDHFNPSLQPLSKQECLLKTARSLGLIESEVKTLSNEIENNPMLCNITKGHEHRDNQDYENALKYYAKAVQYDIPEGMYNLARLYGEGKGVNRDYEESLKWLKKAAESEPMGGVMIGSGIPEAQHSLGLNYYEGVGVDQNFQKAIEWYEKAVKNGYGGSANNLGIMYMHGFGVEKSFEKGFQYFKLASQWNETFAMINLADCYFDAKGTGSIKATAEDKAKGREWLRIAAKNGNLMAKRELEIQGKKKCLFVQSVKDIIQNLNRKFLIDKHRQIYAEIEKRFNQGCEKMFTKANKRDCSNAETSKWTTAKKITLKDMDPTEDKIFTGYVLKGRILDWPVLGAGIYSVLEDENGDVQRFTIYKFPLTGNRKDDVIKVMKSFRPNSIISIIDPFMRVCIDTHSMIRVEDFGSIKIDNSRAKKICSCCGKEEKLTECSNCGLMSYCSEECREIDFEHFNQKNVCDYLKYYKNKVN